MLRVAARPLLQSFSSEMDSDKLNKLKRFNELQRAHFGDLVDLAIQRARQAITEASSSASAQNAPSLRKAATRVLSDIGDNYQLDEVRRLCHRLPELRVQAATIEAERNQLEEPKEASYPSRRKFLRARKPYERDVQWLKNLCAAVVFIEENKLMMADGTLKRFIAQKDLESGRAEEGENSGGKGTKHGRKSNLLPQQDDDSASDEEADVARIGISVEEARALGSFGSSSPSSSEEGLRANQERRERGHWEFEDDSEEELAQYLLKGTEDVEHDGEVTAEVVHLAQLARPGVFEIAIVWVVDSTESPEVDSSQDDQVERLRNQINTVALQWLGMGARLGENVAYSEYRGTGQVMARNLELLVAADGRPQFEATLELVYDTLGNLDSLLNDGVEDDEGEESEESEDDFMGEDGEFSEEEDYET